MFRWHLQKDVKNVTGYTIGVSPIGHLRPIDILIDNSFDRFTELFAAADTLIAFLKLVLGLQK